jgi:hypothetical protein
VPIWARLLSYFVPQADTRARVSRADALSRMRNPRFERASLCGKVIKGRFTTTSLGKWTRDIRHPQGLILSYKLRDEARSFKRMRSCGASLQELRVVGELDITYPASVEFLKLAGDSETVDGRTVAGADLRGVSLTGGLCLRAQSTLPSLELAAGHQVRMHKLVLTGIVRSADELRDLLRTMRYVTKKGLAGPNLRSLRLDLTLDCDPHLLAGALALLHRGARLDSLTIRGAGLDERVQALLQLAQRAGAKLIPANVIPGKVKPGKAIPVPARRTR